MTNSIIPICFGCGHAMVSREADDFTPTEMAVHTLSDGPGPGWWCDCDRVQRWHPFINNEPPAFLFIIAPPVPPPPRCGNPAELMHLGSYMTIEKAISGLNFGASLYAVAPFRSANGDFMVGHWRSKDKQTLRDNIAEFLAPPLRNTGAYHKLVR